MTDTLQSAAALTVKATLTTTCPPPFVSVGDKHLFHTSATLQFTNPTSDKSAVDIALTLKSDGRELARRDTTFEVPPEATTLHTVNWRHEQSLHAGDDLCVIDLIVRDADGGKQVLLSSWQVCQFKVE